MGMFDNVEVEYLLPDTPRSVQRDIFQTKSFGDGFTGGFMDDYTITKDGTLVLHVSEYEMVPEKDRPYYNKPEWDEHPLYQLMGCMKKVMVKDEVVAHNGVVNIYTSAGDSNWYEYDIEFINGKVSDIKRIYREFGV